MCDAHTWECQRSVEAEVPVAFAWAHMTDIRNWNDPPAEFALEGPFVDGTRGTTRMPGQPTMRWTIRHVTPGRADTIEGDSLPGGGALLAHWRFDPQSEHSVTLTQRVELRGGHGTASLDQVGAEFEANLEPGMRKIARTMERRYSEAGEART